MDGQEEGQGDCCAQGCCGRWECRAADAGPSASLSYGAGHVRSRSSGSRFEGAQGGEELGCFLFQFVVVHGRYASLMDAADTGS
ncbi:hypothetical protein ACWC9R_04195 [Streptomyces sp. NPDC001219]